MSFPGDGALDLGELSRVLQKLDAASWTDELIESLLTTLDKSGDGLSQYSSNTGLSFKVDTDRNPKPNLLLPTSTSSLQDVCELRGKMQTYFI